MRTELYNISSWEERLNYFLQKVPNDVIYSKTYQKHLLSSVYIKMKAMLSYKGNFNGRLKTPTLLIRPTEHVLQITEDYGLSEVILKNNCNYFV